MRKNPFNLDLLSGAQRALVRIQSARRKSALTAQIHKNDTLFIGPWLDEVGPELLYWIPWLNRLKAEGLFANKRLIVVSRGGVSSWYKNLTSEYFEVFSCLRPEDFRREQKARILRNGGSMKQYRWSDSERELINAIAAEKGISQFGILHPSEIYQDFGDWYHEKESAYSVSKRLSFLPFSRPDEENARTLKEWGLPSKYIAVKFYSNNVFPLNKNTQRIVNQVIASLSSQFPVIALGIPARIDDHEGWPVTNIDPFSRALAEKMTLPNNLGLQTEVIRGAECFIGTYGGFSVLPAYLGKRAVAFYSTPLKNNMGITFQHESLTLKLYEELAKGEYSFLSLEEWDAFSRMFHASASSRTRTG
jgi:hypothetical protein